MRDSDLRPGPFPSLRVSARRSATDASNPGVAAKPLPLPVAVPAPALVHVPLAMHTRIGVILASVRQGRRGERFSKWIHALIAERPGVEADHLDLRDYPIGAYTYEELP